MLDLVPRSHWLRNKSSEIKSGSAAGLLAALPCPLSQVGQKERSSPSADWPGRSLVCLLDGQEELELRGQLLLGVELVREVDAADAAVRVDLHAQRLDVIRACTCLRAFIEYGGTSAASKRSEVCVEC